MAKDRLDLIREKAKVAQAPENPLVTAMDKHIAAKRGARTGWNPNPGVAPVVTYTPEAPSKPKLRSGQPASRWSPPMDAASSGRRVSVRTQRAGGGVAPPAPVTAQASTDALLDRAAKKRAASRAQAPLPSGAVTGPKLRSTQPASRWSPPMDPVSSSRVSVSTRRSPPPRPAPAPTPTPKPTASTPPAAPKPRLTAAARTPKPRMTPPMATTHAPRARRVGGGRLGAMASATINATQAAYFELTKPKSKKDK